MQIPAVKFCNLTDKKYICKSNYLERNSNKPTFNGRIPSSADIFLNKFHTIYQNKSISQVLKDIIFANDKSLILGIGRQATAFRIPQMGNYIVRVENKIIQNPDNLHFRSLTRLNDLPTKYKFGLPIIKTSEGITISERVPGYSHLGQNLIPEVDKYLTYGYFSQDFSKFVLQEFEDLSLFPLSSYMDFAKKIKFLNDYTNYKIDIKNPNNVMLDKKNKEINVIDFWQEQMNLIYPYNCAADMFLSILDFQRHNKYFERLYPKEQERYYKASIQIINKCQEAARIVGIPLKSDNIEKSLAVQDEIHKPKIRSIIGYNAFLDMYGKHL